MADTDPSTGRPLARPEMIAAAIPQQTGYGKLVVLSSNFAGKEFELARPQMIIGRTDENDLVINHRSISRNHAKVVREPDNGRYTISDLQSSNGVRVNGNDYSKVELRRGDVVDLGHVRLRFVEPGEDFVFSRDAVITDVPETGGKKGLLVAIILGVLVLGGVLVYFVTRGPSDPSGGTGTGTGGMVNNPKPDASEVAVNPPADASETLVNPPADSGAGVSPSDSSDEVKKLLARCRENAQDRKWTELADCGHQLENLKNAEGAEFAKKAAEESHNEVKYRAVETALKDRKDPDLKTASLRLGEIKPGSVYLNDAQKKFNDAKADIIESNVFDLRSIAKNKDCKKYEDKLRTIEGKYGRVIAQESRTGAPKCEQAAVVIAPNPPKTCDPACGEGFVCKGTTCQKKPEVTPPVNPCDATAIAAVEKQGDDATQAGSFAVALGLFENVYRCKPTVASKAYLAACKARNFPRAKFFFKVVGKDSLAQICLKENFDPR
jgi:pSer/pThr/pTyr-binding forkhead associated (FHA) protein